MVGYQKSNMKSKIKVVLLILAGLFVLSQFIPVDRTVPEVAPAEDFLTAVNAPPAMASLIKNACYDCHSYQSEYPWYARVAPVSFWIQGHINEARSHLNFSQWTTYEPAKAAHKLEECFDEVSSGEMPMKSFTWLHPEAQLSDVQVSALAQWFQQTYRSTVQ